LLVLLFIGANIEVFETARYAPKSKIIIKNLKSVLFLFPVLYFGFIHNSVAIAADNKLVISIVLATITVFIFGFLVFKKQIATKNLILLGLALLATVVTYLFQISH
jgi:VIT1/CCC1 family predicted Fe2+/Mn2+ transporter